MADEPTSLVNLRPLTADDAAVAYNWWRDQEVQELSSQSVFTGTPEEFDSFFYRTCVAEDPQRLTAGIVDRQSGRLIGVLVLRLSADGAEGEFGIKIGEKDYWGHGYGREATRAFLRQVFVTTAVEVVYGLVDITNQRASRSLVRAGFRSVGRTPESGYEFVRLEIWRGELPRRLTDKAVPVKQVLLPQRIHRAGEALLRAETDVIIPPATDEATLVANIPGKHGLVVRTARITAKVIKAGDSLQVIGRHGVGYDNIDVATATRRGIPVVITPEAITESVAEHTVGCLLALAKRIGEADRELRRGNFGARLTHTGSELYGKTLGLVGLGRIGGRVAEICRTAFAMRHLAYDPYVAPQRAAELGVELVGDLGSLLAAADFVSLHAPLTAETRGLIGARQLATMKRTAYLVNTARGGMVDEAALIEALRDGTLAGAALDVFAQEPPPADSPLWSLDNVIVTPHMASHTQEGLRRMAVDVAEEVLRVLRGERPRGAVNPEVLK
jgi:D-3-phosphoglycerate dehydrogenase